MFTNNISPNISPAANTMPRPTAIATPDYAIEIEGLSKVYKKQKGAAPGFSIGKCILKNKTR